MKKTVPLFLAFLFIVNYSCKEKIDFEKETEAIMALLKEESASYYDSDFARWSETHIQDSTFIDVYASKNGFRLLKGWEEASAYLRPSIETKRELTREIKTPLGIKIYRNNAWIVFKNQHINNEGNPTGEQISTAFLEKYEGEWKLNLFDRIAANNYYQADHNLLNSINYAKSLGKSVEDIANFTGDQFKTSWNQANGYNGFVNGMLSNWRYLVPLGELKIQEQNDNHIIFSANKMLTSLKANPQFNVTYDDYLLFMKVVCEKIGDYMGASYKQETTSEGVLVTITKK